MPMQSRAIPLFFLESLVFKLIIPPTTEITVGTVMANSFGIVLDTLPSNPI
jgi:hypothetical protein